MSRPQSPRMKVRITPSQKNDERSAISVVFKSGDTLKFRSVPEDTPLGIDEGKEVSHRFGSYDQGYADGVSRGSSALYESMQVRECLLEENERLRMELSTVKGQRDRIRRSLRDLMDRLSE